MNGQAGGGRRIDLRVERIFYTGMACAAFATVFVGFARGFFLHPLFPDHPVPPERFYLLHGTLFAAWMVLLIAQTTLIAAGRRDLHRATGTAGLLLAVGMLGTGVYGALLAADRPGGFISVPVPPLQFLAVPLFDMALFALFVALAVRAIRDPQSHKRWMLLATLSLLAAAIARWPFRETPSPPLMFAIQDAFLLPLMAWDLRTRGRLHPVTLVGAALLVVSQPLRLAISGSAAWLGFAGWLTGLLH